MYTIGTLGGCVGALVLHARHTPAHSLLRLGMGTWLVGTLLCSRGYWGDDTPSTFRVFCLGRAVVGLGAGCVTVSWPPYVEAVTHPLERSLSMTLIEMGTSLGAWPACVPTLPPGPTTRSPPDPATRPYNPIPPPDPYHPIPAKPGAGAASGFLYSASMSEAAGWGYAYLLVGLAGALAFVLPMSLRSGPPPHVPARPKAAKSEAREEPVEASPLFDWLFSPLDLVCGAPRRDPRGKVLVAESGSRAAPWAQPPPRLQPPRPPPASASLGEQLTAMRTSPALMLLLGGLALASGGMQVRFPHARAHLLLRCASRTSA